MPSRPHWSRPLPRLLDILDVMTPRTLADVRTMIEKHLPAETRAKRWQHVAEKLKEATISGETVDVSIPLQMVLSMEHVPYVVKGMKP